MAQVKPFKIDAEGFPVQIDPLLDDLTVNSLTVDSGVEMTSSKVTGLAPGTLSTDAVNKSQLDLVAAAGASVKEMLLCVDQLNATDGFYAAMMIYFAAQPVSGDTIILTDGVTTRTYGAVAGGDVQYALGADAAASMTNFAAAVTGDGPGAWDATFTLDGLDEVDPGGVVAVYENTTAAGDSTSRMHGVWATASNVSVVEFANGGTVNLDYTEANQEAAINLPAADPAEGRFGLRRQEVAIGDGEIHAIRKDNLLYSYDDSGNAWQAMSGPSSIPDATAGSGGAVKGKLTADTDFGLDISAGVLVVDVAAAGALTFPGGDLSVNTDGTTIQINGSNQLEVIGSSDALAVENNFTAQENVSKGDPVRATTTASEVALSDHLLNTSRKTIGLAKSTITATNTVAVVSHGIFDLTAVTVAGSPAAGAFVFIDTTSGLTTTVPVATDSHVFLMGRMTTTTQMLVTPQYITKVD